VILARLRRDVDTDRLRRIWTGQRDAAKPEIEDRRVPDLPRVEAPPEGHGWAKAP
jgi:hypothetical protein